MPVIQDIRPLNLGQGVNLMFIDNNAITFTFEYYDENGNENALIRVIARTSYGGVIYSQPNYSPIVLAWMEFSNWLKLHPEFFYPMLTFTQQDPNVQKFRTKVLQEQGRNAGMLEEIQETISTELDSSYELLSRKINSLETKMEKTIEEWEKHKDGNLWVANNT